MVGTGPRLPRPVTNLDPIREFSSHKAGDTNFAPFQMTEIVGIDSVEGQKHYK